MNEQNPKNYQPTKQERQKAERTMTQIQKYGTAQHEKEYAYLEKYGITDPTTINEILNLASYTERSEYEANNGVLEGTIAGHHIILRCSEKKSFNPYIYTGTIDHIKPLTSEDAEKLYKMYLRIKNNNELTENHVELAKKDLRLKNEEITTRNNYKNSLNDLPGYQKPNN